MIMGWELYVLPWMMIVPPDMTKGEYINRTCAAQVGIPYASDNFTDEEWKRFLDCRKVMGYDNVKD